MNAFRPETAPVGGSLLLSALVAVLPLLTIFLTLGVLRWRAHLAGLAALAVAVLVAVLAFGMPLGLALLSASQGAVFGVFPITFIVLAAIWLYQLTVVSGRFEDLRATFNLISDDPRIQAVLIAFCFGGLLEALAGFGAPVAITAVMLVAVGFSRLRAAVTVLVANTAPVAFGAVAIPIVTAGKVSGIDYHEIGAYVGRQTAVLAVLVPFVLLVLVDGRRGLRQAWPAALGIGVPFAVAKWVTSNYVSVELTDVVASLVGLAAGVVMMRFWQPRGRDEVRATLQAEKAEEEARLGAVAQVDVPHLAGDLDRRRVWMALLPYVLVIAIFSVAKLVRPLDRWLTGTDVEVPWPGLDGQVLTGTGAVSTSTVYTFSWLSGAGTLLVLAALLVAVAYGVPARQAGQELWATVVRLRLTFATIASVLALAYVMNMSGQTTSIGTWVAGAGPAFAFVSPVLGWLGTAVTGSDTSANALFGSLQSTVGAQAGIDQTLLVAANTSGGVVGKLVSPQNLAIGATAVGLVGQESVLLRKVVGWSLGLLVLLCLLVGLQSTPVLSWMLP